MQSKIIQYSRKILSLFLEKIFSFIFYLIVIDFFITSLYGLLNLIKGEVMELYLNQMCRFEADLSQYNQTSFTKREIYFRCTIPISTVLHLVSTIVITGARIASLTAEGILLVDKERLKVAFISGVSLGVEAICLPLLGITACISRSSALKRTRILLIHHTYNLTVNELKGSLKERILKVANAFFYTPVAFIFVGCGLLNNVIHGGKVAKNGKDLLMLPLWSLQTFMQISQQGMFGAPGVRTLRNLIDRDF